MSDTMTIGKIQVFYRLQEQIKDAASRAVKFYDLECKRLGVEYSDDSWNYGDLFVNWSTVDLHWETYHRNCKVDSGISKLPYTALDDNTYKDVITAIVETQKEKQDKIKRKKEQAELAYKRSQLEKLKAELGEK